MRDATGGGGGGIGPQVLRSCAPLSAFVVDGVRRGQPCPTVD
eukprot:gene7751-54699_t